MAPSQDGEHLHKRVRFSEEVHVQTLVSCTNCGCCSIPSTRLPIRATDDLCGACQDDVRGVLVSLVTLVASRHQAEERDDDVETCSSRSQIAMPDEVCDGLPDWHECREHEREEEETKQNTLRNSTPGYLPA